jgi:hypothetical protein
MCLWFCSVKKVLQREKALFSRFFQVGHEFAAPLAAYGASFECTLMPVLFPVSRR